jgi:hypothetical protein
LANGQLTIAAATGVINAPNGVANGATFPIASGTSNFGPTGATDTNGNPIVGASYLAPDNSAYYAYYNNPGSSVSTTIFMVGGVPTVNLPTMGSASYSGSAVGEVANSGVFTHIASGTFNLNYNFGTQTGLIGFNVDGNTFGGTVYRSTGSTGYDSRGITLSGSGLSGSAAAAFFGTTASTTGGLFSAGIPGYAIVGVYAGHR